MDEKKVNKALFEKISLKVAEGLKNSTTDCRLIDITPLDDFSRDIQAILMPFYKSRDPKARRFGTILNSIYTHANNVFVLTKRLAADLVEKDPHYPQKSCDTSSYKYMISYALQNLYLDVLRNPVQNNKNVSGKAGLYELSDPDFLAPLIEMIGISTVKANKDQTLKWYDENNTPEMQENPSPELIAERKRIREVTLGIRKDRNEKS